MDLTMETNNGVLTVHLLGKPDSGSAVSAEKEIKKAASNARQLVLDLGDISYVSSAVLRLILKLNKTMRRRDGMVIVNANSSVMETLELTGFTDFLRIEQAPDME